MTSPRHPSSDSELTVRGERLRRGWGPAACVVGLLISVAWGWAGGGLLGLVGLLLPLAALYTHRERSTRQVRLTATREGLTLDEEPPIAADTIADVSWVHRKVGYVEMRLGLRDRTVRRLRLTTDGAMAILQRLGLEEGERRASFPLVPAFGRRFVAAVLLVGLGSLPVFWFFAVAYQTAALPIFLLSWAFAVIMPLGALVAWLLGVVLRGEIMVGTDGFTIRWPWWSRFVSFREAERVLPRPGGFDQVLVLRRGKPSLTLTPRDRLASSEVAVSLEDHLRGAFQRWNESAARGESTEGLARGGGQDAASWLQSLDARTREQAHYRVAAPTATGLAELLQNPAAAPDERVAAAVALLRRGDEASRARVRAATDGCASPALRETLLALEEARSDEDFLAALALRPTAGRARRR